MKFKYLEQVKINTEFYDKTGGTVIRTFLKRIKHINVRFYEVELFDSTLTTQIQEDNLEHYERTNKG